MIPALGQVLEPGIVIRPSPIAFWKIDGFEVIPFKPSVSTSFCKLPLAVNSCAE